MILRNATKLPALAAVLILAGCAASLSPGTSTGSINKQAASDVADKDLACGRLRGRMKLRMMQIRDHKRERQTSSLSRGLQNFTRQFYGGSSHGSDPNAQYEKDVARLKSQNAILAEKGCKTYDLAIELEPAPVRGWSVGTDSPTSTPANAQP